METPPVERQRTCFFCGGPIRPDAERYEKCPECFAEECELADRLNDHYRYGEGEFPDYGGAFDGHTVTSDAAPGL